MKTKKVLIFGSFDLIHKGHLYFLKSAKKLGTNLTVVLARDKTIKQVKSHKPKYSEKQRLQHLKNTKIPDKVILGYKKNKYKIIEKIKPDIIALGYDQNSFTKNLKQELKKRNLNSKIIILKPFKQEVYKSSKLKKLKLLTN